MSLLPLELNPPPPFDPEHQGEAIGDGPVALWPPHEYVESPPSQLQVQISPILQLYSDKVRTSKIWRSFAWIQSTTVHLSLVELVMDTGSNCELVLNTIQSEICNMHNMEQCNIDSVLQSMTIQFNEVVNTKQDLNCKLTTDTNQHQSHHLQSPKIEIILYFAFCTILRFNLKLISDSSNPA